MSSKWSSGICGWTKCGSDCDICCMAWCFPCVTYANNEEKMTVGGGGWWGSCLVYTGLLCCIGCPGCCLFGTRTRLRKKFDLPEEPCSDCCTHIWCHQCALCQEARELRCRAVDQPQFTTLPMQQMPPQAGHPSQPGYAPPQPGYAPPQGAYPPQPGYPSQGAYPPQPGYPAQGGYPPVPGAPAVPMAPPQQPEFVK